MSVSCIKVEDSIVLKKTRMYSISGYVRAHIDSATQNQFTFPQDYEFAGCFLTEKYEKLANRILNFVIRPDDTWIGSFPKAGTTWVINIVSQLKNNLHFSGKYENCDYKFFERSMFSDETVESEGNEAYKSLNDELNGRFGTFENESSPRLINSHFPAHLLPKDIWTVKPKLIYIHRNAKDVAISMYHMYRNFEYLKYQESMEEYFDLFLNDHVTYAPFFAHVNGFRRFSHSDHVLLLNYDEMTADAFSKVKQISEFLGYSYTDDQLKQLTQNVSFERMRGLFRDQQFYANNSNFFRKGKSGGYHDEMCPEYIRKFDEWENYNQI